MTLTVSAMLRHGVKVDYINKIVQKIDENISSFSSANNSFRETSFDIKDLANVSTR